MPAILAHRRCRQEGQKFKVIFSHISSLKPAWAMQTTFQNKTKQKNYSRAVLSAVPLKDTRTWPHHLCLLENSHVSCGKNTCMFQQEILGMIWMCASLLDFKTSVWRKDPYVMYTTIEAFISRVGWFLFVCFVTLRRGEPFPSRYLDRNDKRKTEQTILEKQAFMVLLLLNCPEVQTHLQSNVVQRGQMSPLVQVPPSC